MCKAVNVRRAALALRLGIAVLAVSPADTTLASLIADAQPDNRTSQQVLDAILKTAEVAPPYQGIGCSEGQRLASIKAAGTLAVLIRVVQDRSRRLAVRASAIGALGCGSYSHAVPTLARLALDANEDVDLRIQGLNGLRALRNPRGVDAAATLTRDSNPGIRKAAYFALSSTPTKESGDALARRLRSDRSATRVSLIWAVFYFGGPRTGIGPLLLENWTADEADPSLLQAYLAAFTEYQVCSAGPRVRPLLHHDDVLVRLYATRHLAACPNPDAAVDLTRMLLDDWTNWTFAWETDIEAKRFAAKATLDQQQRSELEGALQDFEVRARQHVHWGPNELRR